MAFGSNQIEILLGLRDEVTGRLTNVEKSVQRSAQSMQKMGLAAIGAGSAVIAGMTAAFRSTIIYGEGIDKVAKQTGISAEEIQQLSYAAQQEHANIEVLNKGITRLTKNLADAGRGVKLAQDNFDKLGISYRNTDGSVKSAIDVLFELSDSLSSGKISTEEMASALELLGIRGGKELIPFLKLGSNEIRRLMNEAKSLGLVMSGEDIEATKEFGDSITMLKSSIGALGRSITIGLLPVFSDIVERIQTLVNNFQALSPETKQTIGQFVMMVGAGLVVGGALSVVCAQIKLLTVLGSPLMLKILAIAAVFEIVYRSIALVITYFSKFIESVGELFHIKGMEEFGKKWASFGVEEAKKGGFAAIFESMGIEGVDIGSLMKGVIGTIKPPETSPTVKKTTTEVGKKTTANIQMDFYKKDDFMQEMSKQFDTNIEA